MSCPIRIAIVSDDRLYADALAAALGLNDGLLTWPRSVGSRLHSDDGGAPEIVLLDSTPGEERTCRELWRLQELMPEARLVVFGLEAESPALLAFIEAGASGYVLRQSSPPELADTLRQVARGDVPCSPEVLSQVASRIAHLTAARPREVPPQVEALTCRELEVLREIAQGMRNKEIGRRLAITVQTVKNHVHSILEKLQVHRRREAVRRGIELGLIEDRLGPGRGLE